MEMPRSQSQSFLLVGGLDIETANSSSSPGLVLGASNYESNSENGYERIGGYERFDGRPRPSDALYKVLQTVANYAGLVVGNTVNGQTSGATGKAIMLRSANQILLTRITGNFLPNENLRVGVSVIGINKGEAQDIDVKDDGQLSALAQDEYRTGIAQVPGSGPIRGIGVLGNVVYAFRNNAGATALDVYKSTATGWLLVPLLRTLAFNAGTGTPPAEGATITKGTVSGIVARVVLQTGAWTGTAQGFFVVRNITGGEFSAGAFTAGVSATCGGPSVPIVLLPGGRLDHVVYNFTGSTATERMYCCDGVNAGFDFDGTVLTPIRTGMAVDVPRHVWAHRNHLFFAFGGSVQHSGTGAPYAWTVVLGAGEIAIGQDVTGFSSLPGDVDSYPLMIFSANRTLVLYGASSLDWKITTYSAYIGAQRWSIQNIGNPITFSSLGITPIVQTQQFGNFEQSASSERIRRYIKDRVVTASVVNRRLTRMRLFFSGGDAISITPINNRLCFMPISYLDQVVRCATEASINDIGRSFFGTDSGYVYEADVGRSFDGADIEAWAKLKFNHVKSPDFKKRFRKASIEIKSLGSSVLKTQAEYSLAADDIGLTPQYERSVFGGGFRWDISNWDEAYFDSPDQSSMEIRLDGVGKDISLTFNSRSKTEMPHVLQSVTTTYTMRRPQR